MRHKDRNTLRYTGARLLVSSTRDALSHQSLRLHAHRDVLFALHSDKDSIVNTNKWTFHVSTAIRLLLLFSCSSPNCKLLHNNVLASIRFAAMHEKACHRLRHRGRQKRLWMWVRSRDRWEVAALKEFGDGRWTENLQKSRWCLKKKVMCNDGENVHHQRDRETSGKSVAQNLSLPNASSTCPQNAPKCRLTSSHKNAKIRKNRPNLESQNKLFFFNVACIK